MKYSEQEFIQRLTELAPGWVDAINKYHLMYEVFTSFNNDVDGSYLEDEYFLTHVHHAMLEWDL